MQQQIHSQLLQVLPLSYGKREISDCSTIKASRVRKTFLFVHGIAEFRLKAVKGSFLSQGVVLRVHGHTGRIFSNTMVEHDVEEVVKFILQCAETNAILLFSCISGYKRDDIQILPSSTTKQAVWRLYEETATTYSVRRVS